LPQKPSHRRGGGVVVSPELEKDPAARRAGGEVALRPEPAERAAVGAPAHQRRGCHRHDAAGSPEERVANRRG